MSRQRKTRNDPGRKSRIVEATLIAIGRFGVADTSHRRIAELAGVPLGSLTYYFGGLDDLIGEAFRLLSERSLNRLSGMLGDARSADEAILGIVNFICDEAAGQDRDTALSFELYAYATRRVALRPIMLQWMESSRCLLRQQFSESQARRLDAVIEGASIHRTAAPGLLSRCDIEVMVRGAAAGG